MDGRSWASSNLVGLPKGARSSHHGRPAPCERVLESSLWGSTGVWAHFSELAIGSHQARMNRSQLPRHRRSYHCSVRRFNDDRPGIWLLCRDNVVLRNVHTDGEKLREQRVPWAACTPLFLASTKAYKPPMAPSTSPIHFSVTE